MSGVTAKRILHAFAMTYIIVGMFYFYMLSDFNTNLYRESLTYYSFAKGVDLLLILCIIFPLKEVFWQWVCIGIFFAIREVWEVFAIQDYAKASRPSIIFILFCTDILCLITILIIKIVKARK